MSLFPLHNSLTLRGLPWKGARTLPADAVPGCIKGSIMAFQGVAGPEAAARPNALSATNASALAIAGLTLAFLEMLPLATTGPVGPREAKGERSRPALHPARTRAIFLFERGGKSNVAMADVLSEAILEMRAPRNRRTS